LHKTIVAVSVLIMHSFFFVGVHAFI